MARLSREEVLKKYRPDRTPAYEANRNKLFVKGLDHENYYYRWVNDVDDRITDLQERGYELCNKKGHPVGDGGIEQSASVGSKYSKGVGMGVTAYLMRIPMEVWLYDQSLKENDIAELEADMKRSAEAEFKGRYEAGSRKRSNPTAG